MSSSAPPATTSADSKPPIFNYILAVLLVSLAWGFTTPFIRRGAVHFKPAVHSSLERIDTATKSGWLKHKIIKAGWTVVDLLRTPAYAVPLVINLTGSVWFFLLVGGSELSLTVPIVNSLAFLFTVLGEWYADGKIIERDTWIGMAFVLGGITLCVISKST